MGCGASSDKGRAKEQLTDPSNFFPPPDSAAAPVSTIPPPSQTLQAPQQSEQQQQQTSTPSPRVTAATAAAEPVPASPVASPPSSPKKVVSHTSSSGSASAPSSPNRANNNNSNSNRSSSLSPRKKKTPYIPPQPIDGTPSSPVDHSHTSNSKAAVTKTIKSIDATAASATSPTTSPASRSVSSSPHLASSSRKKGKDGIKISNLTEENDNNNGGSSENGDSSDAAAAGAAVGVGSGGDDGSLDAGEELFGGEGVAPQFNLSVVAADDLIDPADLIASEDDEDDDEDDYYRRNTTSNNNASTSGAGAGAGATSSSSSKSAADLEQQQQHQQHLHDQDADYDLPGETASMSAARRSLITITPQPSSESGMRFDELYRLKGVLGTGAFSTVREGFHRSNGEMSYAVKCINRKKLSEEDEAALLDEVAILKEMRHMHIIRLYDFFVEPSTYYLVMERMRGGELFDRVVAKAYYNEKEARDTCKILLEAVGYCHTHHVAHRDLKPENLLLLSEEDDSTVKIADFGFAKKVYKRNCLTTQCGTPGYVAPEILEGTPYDERADMWSVGVILYILLGGYPPFIESTQRDLFRKIRKGEYEFHEEYWGTVSKEAKNLISSLLTVDPESRLTAAGAMEDLWITGDDAKLASNDLGANLKKLQNFNGKRKLRAAVSVIMAMNKLHTLSTAFATGG